MKKLLLYSALFAIISSSAFAEQTLHISPQTLSTIQWQDIELNKTNKTNLNPKQKQAFTLPFAGIESPIAAYRLPTNQGTLHIDITSSIIGENVFIPSAVILDNNFNIATTYPSSYFKLQEERGVQGNRFSAELNLTPISHQGYIYLLIYTTKQDLATTTTVPHPAKSYAIAIGNQPPAIDDIKIKHSLSGEIFIKIDNEQGSKFIGLDDIFPSTKMAKSVPVNNSTTSPIKITTDKILKIILIRR